MNLSSLAWPIFVENSLRMSLMAVDVLMLSVYSDGAVAAVGLSGNLVFFITLVYMITSTGCGVLVGQNLGAQRQSEAASIAQQGLVVALLMGLVIGSIIFVSADLLVGLYELESNVEDLAYQYILIVGSLSITSSVGILLTTLLRAYGHSKPPMWIHLIGGLVNIVGNYIALFGPWGIAVTGVAGVAVATVISQLIMACASFWVIKKLEIPVFTNAAFSFNAEHVRKILAIGVPKAGESISYSLAQIVIMFFVAKLGTAALAAATIAHTLVRFIFLSSLSIGQASQILSSYLVGNGRITELKRNVQKYWMMGVAISFGIAVIMAVASPWLSTLFSDDSDTQAMIASLLFVAIILEPGRAINLIVIMSLQGAGDVVFPVKVGIVSMWLIGVLGAYLVGVHWALGLVGIWLAVALDEWTRGVIMIVRWQREKWIGKALI